MVLYWRGCLHVVGEHGVHVFHHLHHFQWNFGVCQGAGVLGRWKGGWGVGSYDRGRLVWGLEPGLLLSRLQDWLNLVVSGLRRLKLWFLFWWMICWLLFYWILEFSFLIIQMLVGFVCCFAGVFLLTLLCVPDQHEPGELGE